MAARLLLVPANPDDVLVEARGEEEHPRVDVLELARLLDAEILSFADVDADRSRSTRLVGRFFGRSAALAWMGWRRRPSTVLSLSERVGTAFAFLGRFGPRRRPRHVMIAHDLAGTRLAKLFAALGLRHAVHGLAAYTTIQTRFAEEKLGFDRARLFPMHSHVDTAFFRLPQPLDVPMPERTGLVAVGHTRRDDETLVAALADVPVPVTLVDGSRWNHRGVRFADAGLSASVKVVRGLSSYDLRLLYQSASVALVPLLESDAPSGITSIYEALACGTPVVVSATRGLADSLRHLPGVVTVPVGDVEALQRAVAELLVDEHRRTTLGAEGRACVEQTRSLDLYLQRVLTVVRKVEGGEETESLRPSPSFGRPEAVGRTSWSTRLRLRAAQRVGRGVRTLGAPRVLNRGHIEIGDGVTICSRAMRAELQTHPAGRIEIGRNVHIDQGTSIVSRGLVRLGDGCRLGAQTILTHDGSHRRALAGGESVDRSIVLGRDVTLGVRVTVLAGVTIGDGAVVVAGSVVTQDVPPYCLAGGVPAHVLRRLDLGAREVRAAEGAPPAKAAAASAPAAKPAEAGALPSRPAVKPGVPSGVAHGPTDPV
ncbi:MAG: glycosyltransferase [Planctomycetes bacterium]|nr:glycosyltransferase [Planctomycetota bacterium]